MNYREIRQAFLDYFKNHNHEILSSSSLVPRDDPTLLFTNAGMVQFKGLFLGEEKRSYSRAVTSQKCVRAGGKHNDLENVGYTARHHTFFEMLGNFSFGDYFKEEAIVWAWELLTEGYKLSQDKLYASVFTDDDEGYGIWEHEIGLPTERIIRLGEKDNFWAMGDTGPCGPCSEILIDQGEALGCGSPECAPGCECDRYLEIWNLVFTQFDRDSKGNLTPLPKPNIDTGMGLERIAAVVQGVTSNYDSDVFTDIIRRIEDLSERKYDKDKKQSVAFRVIADHARSAAFLLGDGVMPSNEGRGYVLRRIIRRAIRFGHTLGIKDPFLHLIADKVIDMMGQDYVELVSSRALIQGVVLNEERRFADTLHYGMRVLEESLEKLQNRGEDSIPGDLAFKLYDTYGLSLDIVEDVAREEGMKIDRIGYEEAMSGQRSQSQESWRGSGEEGIPEVFRKLTAKGISSRFVGYEDLSIKSKIVALVRGEKEVSSAQAGDEVAVVLEKTPFYGEAGGQVGDRGRFFHDGMIIQINNTLKFGQDLIVHQGKVEEGTLSIGDEVEAKVNEEMRRAIARNHSATHLLHGALREVLGEHVKQAGSLVAPDRLRFDFSHFAQVDREKLKDVETLVNSYIRENYPLNTEEMTREEAMNSGAIAIFEERYGEKVRVVRVGDGISMELCGGTHTRRTGDVGLFKIVNEGAVGANLRRIEAITGEVAMEYVQNQLDELISVASLLKTSPDQVKEKVERLLKEQKEKERELEALKSKLFSTRSNDLFDGVRELNGVKIFTKEMEAVSPRDLRGYADQIKDKLGSAIVVLGAKQGGKAMLICVVTKDLTGRFKAGEIISRLSTIVGGKGGGRPDMAQGGGNRPEKLESAFEAVYEMVAEGERS